MGNKGKEVNEFWQIYKDIVIKTGAPVEKAVWHVRWAEKFAKSIKEKSLRVLNWPVILVRSPANF